MAWWEYIPGVNAIGHLLRDLPGESPDDYLSCKGEDVYGETVFSGERAAQFAQKLSTEECLWKLFGKYALALAPTALLGVGTAGIGSGLALDRIREKALYSFAKWLSARGVVVTTETLATFAKVLAAANAADVLVSAYKAHKMYRAWDEALNELGKTREGSPQKPVNDDVGPDLYIWRPGS
jgi:hypothetical protein